MNLTGTQKMIAAVALLVVAFVAVFFFVVFPMFGRLSDLDVKQAEASRLMQEKQSLLLQLQEAKGRAPQTQAQLVRLANQIPDNPELPTLIVDLQNSANDAGVRFAGLTPSKPEYAGGINGAPIDINYTRLDLNLVVEGTWSDMLDFLRRLNKMSRAARVISVTINPLATTAPAEGTRTPMPEHPILAVSMVVRTYVLGDNGVLVSPAAAATPTAPPPATQ
jgi:type IV pilus assembly protein PilO